MIRALGILAAVAAFAVSAAPASAGSSKQSPPRTAVVVLIGANDYGLMTTDGKKKVPRPAPAGFFLDMGTIETLDLKASPKRLKDGTSNTIMWSGSRKPPKGIIAVLIG